MQSPNLIQMMVARVVRVFVANWWVEISTVAPHCTYYFGPFHHLTEARDAHPGYVEDLRNEGAQEIAVTIKRCQPKVLTACTSEAEK
jgi:hypothetical protein